MEEWKLTCVDQTKLNSFDPLDQHLSRRNEERGERKGAHSESLAKFHKTKV